VFRPNYLEYFSGLAAKDTVGIVNEITLLTAVQRYIIFDDWTIICYCVLASTVWLVGTYSVLALNKNRPRASPFLIIDLLSRFSNPSAEHSVIPLLQDLDGDGTAIGNKLQDRKVYLGTIKNVRYRDGGKTEGGEVTEEEATRIGFSLSAQGVNRLETKRE